MAMTVGDLVKFLKGKDQSLVVLIGTDDLVYAVEKADVQVQPLHPDLAKAVGSAQALVIETGALEVA